jgi:hypothetical protein
LFGYSSPKYFFDHQNIGTMPSKKTTPTSAKWSDAVFEEFIASGMKLEDLLDEDIQPKDYSWHQMRRLCDVYHVPTGGTKEEMAKRLRRARDDAITETVLPSDEETAQLESTRRQVEISDAEEAAVAPEIASETGGKPQPRADHQKEIIDLESKIDQLEEDFAREIDEKLENLKSPGDTQQGTTSQSKFGGFLGFYNRQQDLRSWCADGHPDQNRFRQNGWNPIYFADTKAEIMKWVMEHSAPITSIKTASSGGEVKAGTELLRDERADEETPIDRGISKPPPNRARPVAASQAKRSWGNALDKLKETARQLGMDSTAKDPTRRTLNFDEEQDEESTTAKQQSTNETDASDTAHQKGSDHRFSAFRPNSGNNRFNLRSTSDQTSAYAAANPNNSTIFKQHPSGHQPALVGTPNTSIHNPYSSGRTPLTDKDLFQANDFYLGGRFGKDDGDELEALYDVLNLPKNWFQNVLYTFARVIDEEEVPYLSDKEIKNLPRLSNLEPETLVDWYDDMESELMMISTISLMPFDAIVINWQYVGLCIPGIGERRYLEMARVFWRICEKTLPRDEDAVRNAFKINSNRGRDGFRLLWDVLIRSQPAFNPTRTFPKPNWQTSRDISTLAKRWILYFRFMGKTPDVGFSATQNKALTSFDLFRNRL